MNNQMVAHNWANQTNKGKRGSNFFYEGKSIYSYGYHFEVGRIVETERGQTIVLLQSDSYSQSTNRHQSYARQACNHIESFTLPLNKDARLPFTHYNFVAFFNHYGNIVIESSKKASRSRKYGDLHLTDAKNAVEQWNKLKAHFPKLTKGIKKLKLPSDVQIKKLNDQDKAEKQKEAKKLKKILEVQEKEWIAYDRDYIPKAKNDLLRLRRAPNDKEVETVQGARVPLQDAKRFYGVIKNFKKVPERLDLYKNLGDQLKVGSFRLSNLTPKGANIGCHFIAWSEMERFATQMGWQA